MKFVAFNPRQVYDIARISFISYETTHEDPFKRLNKIVRKHRKAQRLPPLTKTRSSGLSHFPWKYRRTISSSIEQTTICTIAIFTISVTEACQYITSITVGYRNKHFDVTLYAELTAHTDMCSIDICIPLLILRIFISIYIHAHIFLYLVCKSLF